MIMGSGEKEISETEWITRNKYHVSMASSKEIKVGEKLSSDMVTYRNPGSGIPPKNAHMLIGKVARQNIPFDELLSTDMFE
jgi:sialic acid synthase SpsE